MRIVITTVSAWTEWVSTDTELGHVSAGVVFIRVRPMSNDIGAESIVIGSLRVAAKQSQSPPVR